MVKDMGLMKETTELNYGKCSIQYFGAWPILGTNVGFWTILDISASAVSFRTILVSHKSSDFMEIFHNSTAALTWLIKIRSPHKLIFLVSLNTVSFATFRRDIPYFKFKGFSVLTTMHLWWKHWIFVYSSFSLNLLVLVFIDLYWLNHIEVGWHLYKHIQWALNEVEM